MGKADRAVLLATFREHLLRDRIEGRALPVEHYQALFPGQETLIAKEFQSLQDAARPAPPAEPSVGAEGCERFGHFTLERELGRGGQGVVYLATDRRLGRPVALKVLAPGLLNSTQQRQRFEREASLAARLQHPDIATVYEAGSEAGQAYVAMQYVEGTSLREQIEQDPTRPQDLSRAVILERAGAFAAVAHAVHVAHQAGIVHRDIKPGNLMRTEDGRLVVLDFGLARDLDDENSELTRSGDLFGSPAYLPPEQIEGLTRGDERADVYALGVALYEWLTGQRPFHGATREALFRAILRDPAPDIRRLVRHCPRDLSVVLQTALSKDLAHRYQTARDLAQDLEAVRDGRPVAVVPLSVMQRFARWTRRDPRQAALVLGLAAALLAVASFAGFFVARRGVLEEGQHAVEQREIEQLIGKAFGSTAAFADFQSVERLQLALAKDPTLVLVRLFLAIESLAGDESDAALAWLPAGTDPDADAAAAFDRIRAAATGSPEAELRQDAGPLELYTAGALRVRRARADRNNGPLIESAVNVLHQCILQASRPDLQFYTQYAESLAQLARHDRPRAAREGSHLAAALLRLWPRSSMAIGWAATLTPDVQRQAELHRRCLEVDPDQAGSMIFLARHSLLVENNLTLSLQWYERAAEALPRLQQVDEWRDHLLYADALLQKGLRVEAIGPLRRAVEREPTESRPFLLLARILLDRGERDEAEQIVDAAFEQLPESTPEAEWQRLDALRAELGAGR